MSEGIRLCTDWLGWRGREYEGCEEPGDERVEDAREEEENGGNGVGTRRCDGTRLRLLSNVLLGEKLPNCLISCLWLDRAGTDRPE